MEYEIEIPKGFLRWLRIALAVIMLAAIVILGRSVSPVGENGRPQFLTPRMARITSYQQDARRWAEELQAVQASLGELLSNPPGDLLDLDSQASRLSGQLANLQAEVDGTGVPPTLETLHASIMETVNATLEAAVRVTAWISAPTPDNLAAAEDALDNASEKLECLYQNPWVQVDR